jgi:hypothetical protein
MMSNKSSSILFTTSTPIDIFLFMYFLVIIYLRMVLACAVGSLIKRFVCLDEWKI